VVEQFWWAPGIYPGQIKTHTDSEVLFFTL